jgi:ribosomal protein L17
MSELCNACGARTWAYLVEVYNFPYAFPAQTVTASTLTEAQALATAFKRETGGRCRILRVLQQEGDGERWQTAGGG